MLARLANILRALSLKRHKPAPEPDPYLAEQVRRCLHRWDDEDLPIGSTPVGLKPLHGSEIRRG